LLKELDQARRREAEAQKSGDVVKQRELAELTRQREAAAQQQAELTRQREAEAKKQAEAADQRRAEIARLQAESGRKAEPAKKVEPKPVEAAKPAEPARPAEPVKAAEVPRPAEAKATEPTRVASAAPSPPPEAAPSAESMLERAIALEGEGKNAEAARLLRRAARTGSGQATGQAAKRLGDLLQRGAPGVSRDYGEALKYYEIARSNGVEVSVSKGR
jgi:TPR repeat protein